MSVKTKTTPDAPPLVDDALAPEMHEGQYTAKKKFAACFTGDLIVERGTPVTVHHYRTDPKVGPIYLIKRNGKTVETADVKTLQELCQR